MTLTQNAGLTLAKGDTGPLTVTVPFPSMSASNGLNPYHTGSGQIWFYGKYDSSDLDSAAIFTKNLSNGVSVTQDGNNTNQNGIISVTLAPADTASLPDYPYVIQWAVKVRDNNTPASEYTLTYGSLLVIPTATSKVS
jgi:hypothetical protein